MGLCVKQIANCSTQIGQVCEKCKANFTAGKMNFYRFQRLHSCDPALPVPVRAVVSRVSGRLLPQYFYLIG